MLCLHLQLFNTFKLLSLFFIAKRRPKLKSRYKGRVEKAIEYAQTIESWDDLVDPRTLAFYCLGPEPSAFVLKTVEREGKKSKYHPRQYFYPYLSFPSTSFVSIVILSFFVYLLMLSFFCFLFF